MARPERTLTPEADEDAAFIAAVEGGKASLDSGAAVPYENVRRWLLSWGTKDETPAPKCR